MQEISELSKQEQPGARIPIYTVGYGGRSLEQLLVLLHTYNIKFLVDIRSQPYSRSLQAFSKDTLENTMKEHGIDYLFMGDTLGGRPNDKSCYVDGRVDYSKVRGKSFYQRGISRLQTAWDKQLSIALMCAEINPQECHRSKLIGNTLCDRGIEVAHIDKLGKLKMQHEVNDLLRGEQQLSLFDDLPPSPDKMNFSSKKYSLPGGKAI